MYSLLFLVFVEFVNHITSVFYDFIFFHFGLEACSVLTPQPGVEPIPPALEGEVLNWTAMKAPPPCILVFSQLTFKK